jgi:hypothetical protein
VDHGQEHLGGHDDRLLGVAAGPDDLFLDDGQLRDGAFQAQIAPGDHDHVGDHQDVLQVVHGVLPLQLGHHRNPGPVLLDVGLDVHHVLGALHEGQGHGVDAHVEALVQVLDVFRGQGGHGMVHAREGDAFVRGQKPGILGLEFVEAVGLDRLGHLETAKAHRSN